LVRFGKTLTAALAFTTVVLLGLSGGCGGNKTQGQFQVGDDDSMDATVIVTGADGGPATISTGAPGGGAIFVPPAGPAAPTCPANAPLSCYVSKCSNGGHTTLTGKVYDPAGKVPLYNVIVFVPNDASTLPVITPGTSSCNTCDTAVGDYVSVAITDKTGSFTLTDVPTGTNVPLVVQIGKWRRIITIPKISDCATTTVASSGTGQARLPRNRHEGDMPQMALLTGGLDDLGCFLTRIGIDAAEYGGPHSGGRLDVYRGFGLLGVGGPNLSTSNGTAGDCTKTTCPLWSSTKSLESYDIVLLACEGDTYDQDGQGDAGANLAGGAANVTRAAKQAMHDWLNEGGKVFATHFHYTWFQNGPADFQGVAKWLGYSLGLGTCNNCSLDTSFPKGQTFHDWLQDVGALSGTGINLTGVASSVSTVTPTTTSRWIYDSSNNDTKYLSFETPIGGKQGDGGTEEKTYCGKAVFTDLHAGGAPSGDVPGACKQADLTAQEKALEFLFFDLAACVTDDSKPPVPPPPPPK
jgi:hypothetical protein